MKKLMSACFEHQAVPRCLEQYMTCVYRLDYEEKPDYNRLRELFREEMRKKGWKNDGKGLDWLSGSSTAASPKRKVT